jgi:hypothetical protein
MDMKTMKKTKQCRKRKKAKRQRTKLHGKGDGVGDVDKDRSCDGKFIKAKLRIKIVDHLLQNFYFLNFALFCFKQRLGLALLT